MGVLFINKPKDYTSFDVCKKLRRVLNTKKIGHTGTLDPNATGVLIVLYDKDVKADQFLVGHDKEYIGTCKLGIETDTLDIKGKIINKQDCIMPSKDEITHILNSFIGKQKQYPPLTSAIKVNGMRLFEYQRNGIEVDVKPRDVEIYNLELLDIGKDTFTFKCKVSSGTYIRSLLKDILDKLNLIGTLLELERISVGSVTIEQCDDLDDIVNGNYTNHNLYDLLKDDYEVIKLENINDVKVGKKLRLESNSNQVLICDINNDCIAIYEKDGNIYKSKRGLF